MKFVGLLNTNNDVYLNLCELGFKCLMKDKEFYLLTNSKNLQKDFHFSEYNNSHLFMIGNVTNIEEIFWENAGSSEEIEKILCNCIIKNYIKNGEEVFSKLDGSYVITLWDGNKNRLYLSRDSYGTKPLYYYFSQKEGLIFSNNLDILMKVTGKKNISSKALHEYLRFLDISPPYTIYENIYFHEPEKILVTDGKEITLRNISTQASHKRYKILLFMDVIRDFENLLKRSIEIRIKDANNVGILLSGGIDSTLVCALATKIKSNIKAYTVGFDDPMYDESAIAKNIASYLGIEHQVFKFTIEEDYNAFQDFVSSISSPFADPAIIPTFQFFRLISDTMDVVLDGTGGDSLIGIMPARHIRFILKYSCRIPSGIRVFFSRLLKMNETLSAYSPLFDFEEPEELLIRWKGWTKKEISLLCNERCELSHTRHYKLFTEHYKKGPYTLYSLLMGATQDDRIYHPAALFGLNVVFPYWDKDVQQFVKKLPLEYKYYDGTSKVLFRKVLENFIPPSIWDKTKQGFNYPFEKLLKYNDYKLPKFFLTKDAISEHGLFDPVIVEKYLQRFLTGDDTVKFKIWALVIFQAWYIKRHRILK